MAGHNKWSKVKNVKGKEDAKRAKAFTKLSRQITVAVREGGEDPEYNPSLKMAIDQARAENMPNDNIKRAINKATGEGSDATYESMTYEGYGPGGIAIFVECLSDNKNRTAGNIRHVFDKYGGNMGTDGSVSYLFDRKGVLVLADQASEEEVMMAALEVGAEDVLEEDGRFIVYTSVEDFVQVKDRLSEDFEFDVAQLAYVAKTELAVEDPEQVEELEKLIESLEDDDDVQNVYSNWAGNGEEQ